MLTQPMSGGNRKKNSSKPIVKRELYLKKLRSFIGNDLIKVITGMRRTGKSTMLHIIICELCDRGISSDNIILINFEQKKNRHLLNGDSLHDELERISNKISGTLYIFLDEIQNVENWQLCVNSLRASIDCDIYLTGSNSKLLSGELATHLAGRCVEIRMYAFSFSEYLEYARMMDSHIDEEECFQRYMIYGGIPQSICPEYDAEDFRVVVSDIFASIAFGDIIRRYNVHDHQLLTSLLEFLLGNIGNVVSATSIVKYLKNEHRHVSTSTILNYIKYACDVFLFHRVKREDMKGKKILSTNEKYYIADHGFCEAVLGDGTNFANRQAVLENVVYMELVRRGFSVTVGKVGEREIDFVCRKGRNRIYVQVTLAAWDPKTEEREFSAFNGIRDFFPKYIVSTDSWNMSRNGVLFRNVRDFLLDPRWSDFGSRAGSLR